MSKNSCKVAILLSASFFSYLGMQAKDFQIINNSPLAVKILWKSHGLGPETRSGEFILQPGRICLACIESYNENCIHILHVQSLDGKYKTWSKPFCKDSEIIINLKDAESWKGSFIKKLTVEIKDINVGAKS